MTNSALIFFFYCSIKLIFQGHKFLVQFFQTTLHFFIFVSAFSFGVLTLACVKVIVCFSDWIPCFTWSIASIVIKASMGPYVFVARHVRFAVFLSFFPVSHKNQLEVFKALASKRICNFNLKFVHKLGRELTYSRRLHAMRPGPKS